MASLRLWTLALLFLLPACTTVVGPGPARRAISQPAGSAGEPVDKPAIDAYLTGLTDEDAFRGVALVARHGSIVFARAYGMADAATGTANRLDTEFRIGSVTKQFTAMAILILQDRGRLTVEDRLCRFIPDCPVTWEPITLRHLLTHTSGIPNWPPNGYSTPLRKAHDRLIDDSIDWFEQQPLDFPPGSRSAYSNPGYVLLSAVIERVSHQTYGAFLRTTIFGPLHMDHSGVDTDPLRPPGHALGYLKGAEVAASSSSIRWTFGAGSLYSTAGDLDLWDRALITGRPRIVAPALRERLTRVYAGCPYGQCPFPTDTGYAYGWFVGRDAHGPVVHHSGSVIGFWAYNGFYPDANVEVIVLTNVDTVDIDRVSARLNDLAFT